MKIHKNMRNTMYGVFIIFLLVDTAFAFTNKINSIDIENKGDNREIVIQTSNKPTFTVFRLSSPVRVIIDIAGGELSNISGPFVVEDNMITQIGIRQFKTHKKLISRIIIGLKKNFKYHVESVGNNVVLSLYSLQENDVSLSLPTPINYDVENQKKNIREIKEEKKNVKVELEKLRKEKERNERDQKDIQEEKKRLLKIKKEYTTKKKLLEQESKINNVKHIKTQNKGEVLFYFTQGNPLLQVDKIENPPRLIIDMEKTAYQSKKYIYDVVEDPYIKKIRFGKHGDATRAVFDLKSNDISYNIEENTDDIIVSVFQDKKKRDDIISKPHHILHDIRFKADHKESNIIIMVNSSVEIKREHRSKNEWVLELEKSFVPKGLQRRLDVSSYNSVVRSVSTYQISTDRVHIVAKLNTPAIENIIRDGNKIVWQLKQDPKEARVASAVPQVAGFAKEATALAKSMPSKTRSSRKKRISIDLKDAEISSVIRLFADVSGENIITSGDVKGKISLRLRNVVWETALDTILKLKGYEKIRKNNIIRIAPAEVLQKERELEIAKNEAKQKVEETIIKIVTVNYATSSEIVTQLKMLLSKRGSIQVNERTNTLIIEDIRSNIYKLVELTQRLDRQTPQVLIEARIVEASSSVVEQLGIQWGGKLQATNAVGNPTGLIFPGNVIASGAAEDATASAIGNSTPTGYAVNLPAPIGSGSGGGLGFIFGSAGGSQILNLRLSAMEERGEGRIISSPRITTLDNRRATISQGIDIPVSVVSAAGVSTKFIQARLVLEVEPHVTNDGSVLMKIRTSKNEPDFSKTGAQGDPTIVTKEASTEVLVRDSETTVIGGIYTRRTSKRNSGVPFLSKIPIIGNFFKNRRTEDSRTELLIFVTPRIVNRDESILEEAELESFTDDDE